MGNGASSVSLTKEDAKALLKGQWSDASEAAWELAAKDAAGRVVLSWHNAEIQRKKAHAGKKLLRAAIRGNDARAAELLNGPCDVNYTDAYDNTALHHACTNGHAATVKLLLSHGADPELCAKRLRRPLHKAALAGHAAAIKALIRHGVELEATDSSGRTALLLAAWRNHEAACGVLILHGASRSAVDKDGRHAQAVASSLGHTALARYIAAHQEEEEEENEAAEGKTTPRKKVNGTRNGRRPSSRTNNNTKDDDDEKEPDDGGAEHAAAQAPRAARPAEHGATVATEAAHGVAGASSGMILDGAKTRRRRRRRLRGVRSKIAAMATITRAEPSAIESEGGPEALARLRAEHAAAGAQFDDTEFPAAPSSLFGQIAVAEAGATGLLWKGDDLHWRRSHELFAHPTLFHQPPSPFDVQQGAIGNCYLCTAFMVLAEKPEKKRLQRLFFSPASGSTSESYAHDGSGSGSEDHLAVNHEGIYGVKLFKDGLERHILVDDRFPAAPHGGVAFVRANADHTHEGEIWPLLLEKAFAKANQAYALTVGGNAGEALRDLTGAPRQHFSLKAYRDGAHGESDGDGDGDGDGAVGGKDRDKLWATLRAADEQDFLICCSTPAASTQHATGELHGTEEDLGNGLVSGHAYALLEVKEALGKRLLRIRNPWGRGEWNGDWSDASPLWTDELKAAFGYADGDDGVFFVSFADLIAHFSGVDVVRYRDDWHHAGAGLRVDGQQCVAFVGATLDVPVGGAEACLAVVQPELREGHGGRVEGDTDGIVPVKFAVLRQEKQAEEEEGGMSHTLVSMFRGFAARVQSELVLEAGRYLVVCLADFTEEPVDRVNDIAISCYSSAPVELDTSAALCTDQGRLKDALVQAVTTSTLSQADRHVVEEVDGDGEGTRVLTRKPYGGGGGDGAKAGKDDGRGGGGGGALELLQLKLEWGQANVYANRTTGAGTGAGAGAGAGAGTGGSGVVLKERIELELVNMLCLAVEDGDDDPETFGQGLSMCVDALGLDEATGEEKTRATISVDVKPSSSSSSCGVLTHTPAFLILGATAGPWGYSSSRCSRIYDSVLTRCEPRLSLGAHPHHGSEKKLQDRAESDSKEAEPKKQKKKKKKAPEAEWERCLTDEGHEYYYNVRTGESAWELQPGVAIIGEEDNDDDDNDAHEEGEGAAKQHGEAKTADDASGKHGRRRRASLLHAPPEGTIELTLAPPAVSELLWRVETHGQLETGGELAAAGVTAGTLALPGGSAMVWHNRSGEGEGVGGAPVGLLAIVSMTLANYDVLLSGQDAGTLAHTHGGKVHVDIEPLPTPAAEAKDSGPHEQKVSLHVCVNPGQSVVAALRERWPACAQQGSGWSSYSSSRLYDIMLLPFATSTTSGTTPAGVTATQTQPGAVLRRITSGTHAILLERARGGADEGGAGPKQIYKSIPGVHSHALALPGGRLLAWSNDTAAGPGNATTLTATATFKTGNYRLAVPDEEAAAASGASITVTSSTEKPEGESEGDAPPYTVHVTKVEIVLPPEAAFACALVTSFPESCQEGFSFAWQCGYKLRR